MKCLIAECLANARGVCMYEERGRSRPSSCALNTLIRRARLPQVGDRYISVRYDSEVIVTSINGNGDVEWDYTFHNKTGHCLTDCKKWAIVAGHTIEYGADFQPANAEPHTSDEKNVP